MEVFPDVSPGLFDLPLPINDKNIDKDAVKRKLLDVEHDLKSRLGRPEELAILNLLGLLKFSLKRYDVALEDFRAVLKKDPDNLNAMANMQHVLSKLHRLKEASHFQCQLEDWNGHTAKGGASAQVLDPADQIVIKARSRCLAEQAYVFAANIHTDDASNERYQQSNQICKHALGCAGKVIDTPERDFWEFIVAKNCNKLFNDFTFGGDQQKSQDYLEESVDLFYGITQRVPGDPEYQWESWRNMADIFRRINQKKHLSHSLVKLKELRHYIETDPEECMKKAMEISPDNPRLLARYANFVYSLKRDTCTKRALGLLDRSISLDDSDYNFYAFSTRGMIHLKSYQWKLRVSEEDGKRYKPPKLDLLEMANADLEKAVAFRNTSWNLMALADVQCHIVKHYSTDSCKCKYIGKVFELLAQAEECNDQAVVLKDVSRARGRIFFDLGEYRQAINCFQMAVDREPAATQYTGYYHELFRSYLFLLKSKQDDETFLSEMANSLRQAIIKYGGGNLITYCFGRLRKVYSSEIRLFTDFCEKIVDNKGLLYVLKSTEPTSPLTPPTRQGGTLENIWTNPLQPHRPKAAKKVNLMDQFEALSDTPERREHKSDVGLTASACTLVEGSDTQEEDEGIRPLLSGISGMGIGVRSGLDAQEPGGQPRPAGESNPGALSPDNEHKFEYDFYVMHGESDEKWVEDVLFHELMIVRELKGCSYNKNAPLGSYVIDSKLVLMKQCACILIPSGEDFEDRQYLVQQTLKFRKKYGPTVIPIEREGSTVPDELSVMNSFDASTGRVDWDRLAQSIKNTKGAPSYRGTKTEPLMLS